MTKKAEIPDPGQLLIEAEGMPEVPAPEAAPRFEMNRRRAFGSVPGLIGKELDIPEADKIPELAKQNVQPQVIRAGLLGPQGRHSVNGIVLNPAEYQLVVRSPKSFLNSVQATTLKANQNIPNDVRLQEKELKSGKLALEAKAASHEVYLTTLAQEKDILSELLKWQRTPGFAHSTQIDIVSYANQAWNLTFRGMLQTLKHQHHLTAAEHIDMTNAMAHRLFRGPQRQRMEYWGGMLEVALEYTRAKNSLFTHRLHKVATQSGKLALNLEALYDEHGL